MTRMLVLCAAFLLCASTAFAVGADITANACPGGLGSAFSITMDCAGGDAVSIYATFQPNEAITDLVAIDATVDFADIIGDLASSANFWDFALADSAALVISGVRPSVICNPYLNAWAPPGSGVSMSASVITPSWVRIAAHAFRPTNLAVATNQKVFGFGLTIDGTAAVEAGGAFNGCPVDVRIDMPQLLPVSAGGATVTPLTGPSAGEGCIFVNDTGGHECIGLPALRHTWGQLKSLYR